MSQRTTRENNKAKEYDNCVNLSPDQIVARDANLAKIRETEARLAAMKLASGQKPGTITSENK